MANILYSTFLKVFYFFNFFQVILSYFIFSRTFLHLWSEDAMIQYVVCITLMWTGSRCYQVPHFILPLITRCPNFSPAFSFPLFTRCHSRIPHSHFSIHSLEKRVGLPGLPYLTGAPYFTLFLPPPVRNQYGRYFLLDVDVFEFCCSDLAVFKIILAT